MKEKRMRVLWEKYNELAEKMEADGYELTRLIKIPVMWKVVCRMVQLIVLWIFGGLAIEAMLGKAIEAGIELDSFSLTVISVILGVAGFAWLSRIARTMLYAEPLEEYLPVDGFFAKRRLRREIEDLQTEIERLNVVIQNSPSIMDDFRKLKEIAEKELYWECTFEKESGKKACIKIQMPNKGGRHNGATKYRIVDTRHDIGLEGLGQFAADIAMALEWEKVKLRETELTEEFIEKRLHGK